MINFRGGVLALTPTTVLVAAVIAYAQENGSFDLLEALKGNKPGGDSKQPSKEPPAEIKQKAKVEVDIRLNPLVVLKPPIEEPNPEVKVEESGTPSPVLNQLPYFVAYNDSQQTGHSLAVFLVRSEDPELVRFINTATLGFESVQFRRYLCIAVLGPNNPNMKHFDVQNETVEMLAWYRRDGEWKTNRYIGLGQVKNICNKMQVWLGQKDAYDRSQKAPKVAPKVAPVKSVPRSFQLIRPLRMVR
jgi:hypothetical protein